MGSGARSAVPTPGAFRATRPRSAWTISRDRGRLVLYVPHPVEVEIALDVAGYRLKVAVSRRLIRQVVDPGARPFGSAEAEPAASTSRIAMHGASADVLIVSTKE